MKLGSQRALRIVIYLLVLVQITVLVYQRHQNTGYFNWRSTMWGDAAGYYVYSPALFIYGFDASKLPKDIVEKTGEGFVINEQGKIVTRYTCGVAIMQTPVFLAVHILAKVTGKKQDGFSGVYHSVSIVAAILYAFGGLLLMWHFLQFYYKKWIVFFTLLTLFSGTNLLYYTIDATGMSHIYSFFLFALLLVLSQCYFHKNISEKRWIFLAISLVSALIVLVRPTNLLFIVLVFLLDINSFNNLWNRLKSVFSLLNIVILTFSFFIIFLPQILYWKYSSGNYITDSYEGYGFTNWASPKIIEFLFSTNNGLLTYNPFYFIIVFALGFMIFKKQLNGYYIFFLFAGLIYIFSSWFVFSFGCGFGSRNFVEYTTIFSLPLCYFYRDFLNRNLIKWLAILPIILVMVFVNIKLTRAYNKCFLDGDWNWEEYYFLLKSKRYNQTFTYEPYLVLNNKKEFSEAIRIGLDSISTVNFRRAIVKVDTKIFKKDTKANLVLQITTPDSTLYWNGISLGEKLGEDKLGSETTLKGDFWLPRHYTTKSEISTFIWNMDYDSLYIYKIKVHLE